MKKIVLIFTAILVSVFISNAQKSIVGTWQTIDDDGVTASSEVKIWKEGNEYKGKVIKIYKEEDRNNVCDECDEDDPRYMQKIQGMTIITNMEKTEDNMWEDGEILDPGNGSEYSCEMWLDDDGDLVVRGFIGFSLIGRSQTWKRLK